MNFDNNFNIINNQSWKKNPIISALWLDDWKKISNKLNYDNISHRKYPYSNAYRSSYTLKKRVNHYLELQYEQLTGIIVCAMKVSLWFEGMMINAIRISFCHFSFSIRKKRMCLLMQNAVIFDLSRAVISFHSLWRSSMVS